MVKAHSLLYAVYICLLVSIICAALLYFSNLYNQLNSYYNIQEELYLSNQSIVNFALGSNLDGSEIPTEHDATIAESYQLKQHGLLTLLLTQSIFKNDTVASAHFVGGRDIDKKAMHLPGLSKPLLYAGKVKIGGDAFLPSATVRQTFIDRFSSDFIHTGGQIYLSEPILPELNPEVVKIFDNIHSMKRPLESVAQFSDSLFFNSFFNPTIEVDIPKEGVKAGKIFKGNFILRGKDSIRVSRDAILEDVILIAPKIIVESGFKGSLQALSTQNIEIQNNVRLEYPSLLCVYSRDETERKIKIGTGVSVFGAVVLFGNPMTSIEKNNIEIDENGLIVGTIYCSGKLLLKSNVYGSVYTNRFYYKTISGTYENTICNITIDAIAQPDYFISIPLFGKKHLGYGIIKKVL